MLGFKDKTGEELKIQRKIETKMRKLFESSGYQEYEPPLIERAEIYEECVGSDPTSWIEDASLVPKSWENIVNRDFLPIIVTNFKGDNEVGRNLCILRPEGTASLCRYIARNIVEKKINLDIFPQLKKYYIITCYRNEGIDNLSSTKLREFNQIGLENVGISSIDADIEAFFLAYEGLRRINVPQENISVRVSDVNIFRELSKASEYDIEKKVRMKENIDELSKARLLEKDYELIQREIEKDVVSLPSYLRNSWKAVCSVCGGESAISEIESETNFSLRALRNFFSGLKKSGIPVSFDPAMIRSWEYYTGPICQIDVTANNEVCAEVAGGGRYDTLIGNFLKRYSIEGSIPATGFAYGTERLISIKKSIDKVI